MTGRSWTLRYDERPWSLNQERSQHFHARAARVKPWRAAFCELATQADIPLLNEIHVIATPYLKGRRQDIGNCFPAAKAAVDGLIDAGVIDDDNPDHWTYLGFRIPVMGKEDALEIEVIEIV